jgi:hypothetical protein
MLNLTAVEPAGQLVEQALEGLVQQELAEFAAKLETARVLWRKYRALVEAPEFPPHLRAAFSEIYDSEPDDDRDEGTPDPAIVRENEQANARQAADALIARAWAANGQPLRIV